MGLMKKLTSALVASSLVLSLAGSAFAAYTPSAGETAGMRMMELKILKGRPGDDKLAVNAELTRAELVTIIVRAFGKEADAQLLKGATAFPDSASHWASGEIAMAKALVEKAGSDAIGMPDGTFAPDAKLTPAQAVAFLMKFMGIKRDTTKSWPADYLDAAVEAGLITADDKATIAPMVNENATRGLAFYLFDNAFYSYELPNGKTFYTTYADTEAPALTATAEATTMDSKVTVTGTVGTDAVAVYVGSTKVTPDANGAFSADVALAEVKEYDILVTAADVAGNVAEKTLKVSRILGTASAIEAAPITVAAGATVDVAAAVKDAKGNTITGATISGESTIGTFADGKFTAGKTAGTGTLTLKSGEITANVNVTITAGALAKVEASAVSVKVGEQVTLTAKDEHGNAVTGATFSQASTDAMLDGVTGKFMASKAGNYTVTATKDGVSATATVGVYSTTVAKVVVSAPATVVGNSDDVDASFTKTTGDVNGSVYEVTVKAVDSNGNLVANYGRSIVLTVPAGFYAAADDDATFNAGARSISKAATNGVATFKVYADYMNVGRSFEFTARTTLADATVIGDSSSERTNASVEIVEQVATSVMLSTSSTAKYLRTNDASDATTIGVYVADQNGKRYLETNGYVVNLAVTGPATIAVDAVSGKTSTTTTYAGSTKTVTLDAVMGRVGTVTLTATVEGLGTVSHSLTAAIAEDAAKITVTTDKDAAVAADVEEIAYTVQITDANGVPVAESVVLRGTFAFEDTDGELTLTDNGAGTFGALTVDSTNDVTNFAITTDANGKAEFKLTAYAFVGDLKLTVKDNDSNYTVSSVEKTVAFKADEAAQFGLTRTSGINVGTGAPTTSLSVQLFDAAGNKVMAAGKKITFTSSADVKFNGTSEKLEVLTDANGVATVDVAVLAYVGNNYTVTVTSTDSTPLADNGDDTITISVVNAVATTMSYSLKDSNGATVTRVTAGEAIYLTVTPKDAAGKVVLGDSVWFVPAGTVYSDAGYTTAISKTSGIQLTDGDSNGTYTGIVYPATAGTLSFTLKDKTSSTVLEQSGAMRVVAGAAFELAVNGGNDIKVAESKESGAITLKLVDEFGNAVATSTALDITWDNASVGIRTAVNAANASKLTIPAGQSSVTFYVWNSLSAGTYTVNFTGGAFSGSVDVVVE